mmetsp:Transcript_998/g.868  ORF Transcript_998/g.868 Transcript_998/m.868 type:complete len:126 (+) Transcript_998:29-406(+)
MKANIETNKKTMKENKIKNQNDTQEKIIEPSDISSEKFYSNQTNAFKKEFRILVKGIYLPPKHKDNKISDIDLYDYLSTKLACSYPNIIEVFIKLIETHYISPTGEKLFPQEYLSNYKYNKFMPF